MAATYTPKAPNNVDDNIGRSNDGVLPVLPAQVHRKIPRNEIAFSNRSSAANAVGHGARQLSFMEALAMPEDPPVAAKNPKVNQGEVE